MSFEGGDKKIQDPGFGAKYYKATERLVNKDGSFNVKRTGASPFVNSYQFMIKLNWISFLGMVFLLYIGMNLFFAGFFFILGPNHFIGMNEDRYFLQMLFFSTQTLTTVGYGAISPVSVFANFLSSFESFVGLLFFAMATGLLYGRFSKPNAKIKFSDSLLVSPYQEGRALMFRLVNTRSTQLSEMKAKMIYSFMEEEDGLLKRNYYNMKLDQE